MAATPLPLAAGSQLAGRTVSRRTLVGALLDMLAFGTSLLALVPLFAVLYMLIQRGGRLLSIHLFTQLPPTAMETGGGFGNAIVGTLIMVGIASAISVPFGLLVAIYLAEVGGKSRLADRVRFAAKTLTGFPSILAGVFAYGAVVVTTGGFSAWAGGIALSVLMLPTIILTGESAITPVPSGIREAAIGLGGTPLQVISTVTLPAALPSIFTGVMLGVARAAGETAPLLFTALSSAFWPIAQGKVHLATPTASLAVLIYNFSSSPYDNLNEMAWAASLVLVLLVLAINLAGRALGPKRMH